MPMTSDAKRALSATIRSLRTRLLGDPRTDRTDGDLHDATQAAYRLSVRARDSGLDEGARTRRARLEAWIAEQLRAQAAGGAKSRKPRTANDFRREAEKQAAYTLLNRLVILRLMEVPGPSGEPLRAPAVVTGGWESRAYKDFRQIAPAADGQPGRVRRIGCRGSSPAVQRAPQSLRYNDIVIGRVRTAAAPW
jgi:hypothetical protein